MDDREQVSTRYILCITSPSYSNIFNTSSFLKTRYYSLWAKWLLDLISQMTESELWIEKSVPLSKKVGWHEKGLRRQERSCQIWTKCTFRCKGDRGRGDKKLILGMRNTDWSHAPMIYILWVRGLTFEYLECMNWIEKFYFQTGWQKLRDRATAGRR